MLDVKGIVTALTTGQQHIERMADALEELAQVGREALEEYRAAQQRTR